MVWKIDTVRVYYDDADADILTSYDNNRWRRWGRSGAMTDNRHNYLQDILRFELRPLTKRSRGGGGLMNIEEKEMEFITPIDKVVRQMS